MDVTYVLSDGSLVFNKSIKAEGARFSTICFFI